RAAPGLLRRRDLEPVQRGSVVRNGELERGGAVGVPGPLSFLGLFAGHREGLRVVLVGTGVERLQLVAGVLLAEGDPQGDRVTDRIAAGRLGEPPAEGTLAGGSDGIGLAGPWPRLT